MIVVGPFCNALYGEVGILNKDCHYYHWMLMILIIMLLSIQVAALSGHIISNQILRFLIYIHWILKSA